MRNCNGKNVTRLRSQPCRKQDTDPKIYRSFVIVDLEPRSWLKAFNAIENHDDFEGSGTLFCRPTPLNESSLQDSVCLSLCLGSDITCNVVLCFVKCGATSQVPCEAIVESVRWSASGFRFQKQGFEFTDPEFKPLLLLLNSGSVIAL